MNKTIKINFLDFWEGFDTYNNIFYKILKEDYNIQISDEPDYIICSVFGNNYLQYPKSIKIFFTGENITPNFSLYDYCIGFDYLTFSDRYIRFPLYKINENYNKLFQLDLNNLSDDYLLNRKFCSFIVSNAKYSDPIRIKFFEELSKYKKVDSGGKILNNINKTINNKIEFLSNYKFNIAFENSNMDGYTTEKITDAFISNTVPIYWGNKLISKEFDEKSYINVNNFSSISDAISYIIYLDQNNSEYLNILKSNKLIKNETYEDNLSNLRTFLKNIFDKNIKDAKRVTDYGFINLVRSYKINNNMLF